MQGQLPFVNSAHKSKTKYHVEIIICATIGVLIIGISLWSVIARELLFHRGVKVPGTIVAVSAAPVSGTSATIVVEYYDNNGVLHREAQQTGWETSGFREGDSISILYDPNDPTKIRSANRSDGSSYIPYIVIIVGVFFIIRAVGLWKATPYQLKEYLYTQQTKGNDKTH
jgi:hypothetical protein